MVSTDAPQAQGDLVQQALNHVSNLSPAFGFAAGEPAEYLPDPNVQQTSAGSSAVHLQQQYHGIPIFQMTRTVRFSPRQQIDDVVGSGVNLPPGLDTNPKIDATQAVRIAATYVTATENQNAGQVDGWGQQAAPVPVDLSGYEPSVQQVFPKPDRLTIVSPGPFEEPIPARLVVFYQGPTAPLGWHVLITLPGHLDQYAVIIRADDPQHPEVLYCKSTMRSLTVEGKVFTQSPSRTPWATVNFPRAAADYPQVLNGIPPAFPTDWCFADSTEGNNVRATLANAASSLKGKLSGSKIVFAGATAQDDDQKVINIFYFCNYMHNFLYLLGFDEQAGNFQLQNPGGAGLPSDAIIARSWPGVIFGTANMSTPRDGLPPKMNMGLVQLPDGSSQHTAFDADEPPRV